MPLGGGVFKNPPQGIFYNIIKAIALLELRYGANKINIALDIIILTWKKYKNYVKDVKKRDDNLNSDETNNYVDFKTAYLNDVINPR